MYRDKTETEIRPCRNTNDDSIILRQIALNLAAIADVLAEINQRLDDIQDTISYRNAED